MAGTSGLNRYWPTIRMSNNQWRGTPPPLANTGRYSRNSELAQRAATVVLLAMSVALNLWNIRTHFWSRIMGILDVPDPISMQGNMIRQEFFQASIPHSSQTGVNQTTASNMSLSSLQSPSSLNARKRRLEFVHIPKTAGSAIEQAALEHDIKWGYLHFSVENGKGTRRNSDEVVRFRETYGGFPWHIPPCLLSHQNQRLVSKNPYAVNGPDDDVVDLFAVVRNPYDRLISEYRYFKLMIRKSAKSGAYRMNQFIQSKLKTIELGLQKKLLQSNDTCHLDSYSTEYFLDKGHYIPQYDYVYATNGETNETVQMITNVLKYESLQQDFAALMQQYGLQHIQLSESKEHRTHENQPGQQHLTRDDLSPENIRKINQIYRKDFIAFGYQMKTPA